jgi:hypothetical protein
MRPVTGALAVLACYSVLTIGLTWPLAANLTTHLPYMGKASEFDTLYMGWVLAHESRAFTGATPSLLDTNIYYPARRTLFFGDTGFGALPYFLPPFLLTGNPTLALNVLMLGSVTLTAWTLHLTARLWTGSHLAGMVAGSTFLATPTVLRGFLVSAPSYTVLQYFPLIMLLAATPAPRFTRALLLLPLIVLQSLSDVIYIATALYIPLGLLALVRLSRRQTFGAGLRLLAVLALGMLVLSPVYLGHLRVRVENPDLPHQTVFRHMPTQVAALPWGPLFEPPTDIPIAAWLLVGLGTALYGLRPALHSPTTQRGWAQAGFWAAVGLLLFMPAHATWHGRWIVLPQAHLASWLPVLALRATERLRIPALIALALLAGLAFEACARCLPGRGRVAPLAGRVALVLLVLWGMYAQHGAEMLPAGGYGIFRAPAPDSPLIRYLEPPGGPLLELPVRDMLVVGLPAQARAMYRSIYHGRPLLNGYNSYWPRGFPERMKLAQRLPDPQALAVLSLESGLELILVHSDYLHPNERRAWLALTGAGAHGDLRLVDRDQGDLLFAVQDPSAASTQQSGVPGTSTSVAGGIP